MSMSHRSHHAVGLAAAVGAIALAGLGGLASPGLHAADPPPVYVTSTGDGPPGVCEGPGARRPCTLRDAIETVAMRETGRRIEARHCGPMAPGPYCLSPNDPNYDAVRGVWRITLTEPYGFDITGTQVTIDFAAGVSGWDSAADNVVELATGDEPLDWHFGVDGEGHVLRGFNLRGALRTAAVVLYNGASGVTLDGLAFADIEAVGSAGGDAIRIRDEHTSGNRLSGIQCGWFGPPPSGGAAPPPTPITGACLEISRGAHDNVVGDGELRSSVFANAGVGVRVTGRGTRANRIARARIADNGVGVRVLDEAAETVLFANTVVGSAGNGIEVAGTTWRTEIAGNHVGLLEPSAIGDPRQPNAGWGIDIAAPAKSTFVRLNPIQYNGLGGVRIQGRGADQNLLTVNLISGHDGPAIAVLDGANRGIQPPTITGTAERVIARSCPGCTVELYADPDDEARQFLATAKADNSGSAILVPLDAPQHRYLTALSTDPDGNSSALSAPLDLEPPPTPTAGPPPGRPVWLPIAWRGAP